MRKKTTSKSSKHCIDFEDKFQAEIITKLIKRLQKSNQSNDHSLVINLMYIVISNN